VLLLSAAYYGLYLNAGFNFTDDGNFAQTAYELLAGRSFADLAPGYGLLWFKMGELLFGLFGVHYLLVRSFFFACIALTNLMIFTTLQRVSGRLWFAAAFTVIALLVPAFPATAFYGLCVLLNASAQIRLASRNEPDVWDGALCGAALALTFQVRPDFGYVFLASLAVVLLLMPSRDRVIGAVTGFAATSLPFTAAATAGGYLGLFARQYADYPALLAEFLLNGLRGLNHASAPLAVLQRPAWSDPGMAALVYVPPVVIAAYAIATLATARRRFAQDRGSLAVSIVALTAGVAALPHYFFFRPDLSHIANFMPGFILMCSVMIHELSRDHSRLLAGIGAAAVSATLALYLWIGLPSPATGAVGEAFGRDQVFRAENGVHVRVAADEKAQLESLRDVVLAHSQPGDAIVCLPYCPGIAFMTARRMLLSAFYADETFLVRKPTWLPEAIAKTRAARPPVVIIADWAINGTEESRFTHWATSYVEAVAALAQEKVTAGGATAYVLAPQGQ